MKPSVWVYNITDDKPILHGNIVKRPLASITKLMTAMIALDYYTNLDAVFNVTTLHENIIPIDVYSLRELIGATLVVSDNAAAEALAENFPEGRDSFINKMNDKAQKLGMTNTIFVDASGTGKNNISTPSDIHKMLIESLNYDFIKQTSGIKKLEINKHNLVFDNTNLRLLETFNTILVSKTGRTNAAGHCIGLIIDAKEKQYSVIVLGLSSDIDRYLVTSKILNSHLI